MTANNNDSTPLPTTALPVLIDKSSQAQRPQDYQQLSSSNHHHHQIASNDALNASIFDNYRQSFDSEEDLGSKSNNVGNEPYCKRKFSKMVQTTYRIQTKTNLATTVQVVFKGDYVHKIRLTLPNGQVSDYPFTGNSQYIPPEIYLHAGHSSGLSDVWVLGISLYQMLVGSYPFKAKDDRKLVKKMLHADFSIPEHLSEDVKDLLRRMLAPEQSRASLDLVMFHPWLKPYRVVLSNPSVSSLASPRTSLRIIKKNRTPKWRRMIIKTCRFLFLGPYPPPARPYRELVYLGR